MAAIGSAGAAAEETGRAAAEETGGAAAEETGGAVTEEEEAAGLTSSPNISSNASSPPAVIGTTAGTVGRGFGCAAAADAYALVTDRVAGPAAGTCECFRS